MLSTKRAHACSFLLASLSLYYWTHSPPIDIMSSPEQIASELADIPALLDAQAAAGLDRDEVIESLFRSWTSRFTNLGRLNDKGKTVITQALNGGPWSASQVKDLASILLHGKSSAATSGKAAHRRPNQKCMHFENFIPMSVIIKLRDPLKYSQPSRASMLAAAARSIGIELADLPTLFRMTAILAYLEGKYDYTQQNVFDIMDSIQGFIKSVPRDNSLPFIEHYPVDVSGLPEPIRKHAYTPDAMPVVVDWPELSTVLGSNKMKGNRHDQSKGSKAPAWLEHVPTDLKTTVLNAVKGQKASGSSKAQHRQEPECQDNGTGPANHTHPPHASQQWHPTNHTADIFRFQAPPQTAATDNSQQRKDPAIWDADEDDDGLEGKGGGGGDLESMELEMVKTLKGRKAANKRPAGNTRVCKKPAGKTQSMKKPAACKSSNWKLLHSKIYAKTRRLENEKHGDDEKAKTKASAVCAKAKEKFDAGELTLANWQN